MAEKAPARAAAAKPVAAKAVPARAAAKPAATKPVATKPATEKAPARAAAAKPAAAKAAPARAAAKPAATKPAATKPVAEKAPARAAAAKPVAAKARAAAKPAATKPVAAKAPARAAAKPAPTGRARTSLGAGNAQVKPRASKISPADIKVAEAMAAAEPKRVRGRKRPAPLSPDRLELLVTAAKKSLEDDKAEDIKVLDVTGRASYADRIIIATGLADRQIQAMATHLQETLAKEGMKLKRDAIQASSEWVLIDCGDMVIHLFKPEARDTFRLEKMWGDDSPNAEIGSGYEPA
ncbi:ribosome silencing factor [Rhodovarius sp.]|uniref:ribosome silencing factor n=1 Tax=Rhodovarius sp. TaxID=2972673 RepID=UPI0038D0B861